MFSLPILTSHTQAREWGSRFGVYGEAHFIHPFIFQLLPPIIDHSFRLAKTLHARVPAAVH